MNTGAGGMTADQLYRAILTAELDALVGDGDRSTAIRLSVELLERAAPGMQDVATDAFIEQRDSDLALVFVAAGATGRSPVDVWALTATAMALEDEAEAGGD